MSYRPHHGITLVGNSTIENLNLERLAADPAPLVAGRVWYNTTDKVARFSSLNGEGGVVVETFATEAGVAQLEALVNIINGDSLTEGSFRKEVADVIGAAPETLDTMQEIAAALNNDPDLYNTLTTLVNTSISDLNDQILGTATEAMDTLGEVQAAINGINTTIGALTGLTTADKTSIVAAVNEIKAASTATNSALAAETAARTAATGDLATLSTTDKSSLVAAINEVFGASGTVATDLATEITRAKGVEGTLADLTTTAKGNLVAAINEVKAVADQGVADAAQVATDLAAETAARAAADGDLTTLDTTEKGSLVGAINEIKTLAGDGDTALRSALNGKIKIYESVAAETTAVFNHGLTGTDLTVQVMVKDGAKWANHSVLVEMDPATTSVTVPMASAEIVKIIVEDKSSLAV